MEINLSVGRCVFSRKWVIITQGELFSIFKSEHILRVWHIFQRHRSIPSVENYINIINNLWRRNHAKNLKILRRCAVSFLYTFLHYIECIQYLEYTAIWNQMHSLHLYVTAGIIYACMLFLNCHPFIILPSELVKKIFALLKLRIFAIKWGKATFRKFYWQNH